MERHVVMDSKKANGLLREHIKTVSVGPYPGKKDRDGRPVVKDQVKE